MNPPEPTETDRLKGMPVGLFTNAEALAIHAEALAQADHLPPTAHRWFTPSGAGLTGVAQCRQCGVFRSRNAEGRPCPGTLKTPLAPSQYPPGTPSL